MCYIHLLKRDYKRKYYAEHEMSNERSKVTLIKKFVRTIKTKINSKSIAIKL